MKAGILLCDHTREHLQPRFGDYPDVFVDLLASFRIESVIYDLTQNVFPQSTKEVDFFIITGSKKSCYEDIDWIHRLCAFVRECQANATKVIGICFGHQVIAHALGGLVEQSSKGWGIGVHTYQVLKDHELFEQRSSINALVSHKDQVITPPENAQLIAVSDFCPYAVLGYNHHFISIQCHPELEEDYIKTILDIRREEIGEQTFAQAHRDFSKKTSSNLIFSALLNYLALPIPETRLNPVHH